MKANENPADKKEFLERLSDAFAESYLGDDESLDSVLREEGIDPAELVSQGLRKVQALHREQLMSIARAERREALRQIKERITKGPKLSRKELAERILGLAAAGVGDSQAVLAFHRKLKSISDEDLESFLEDAETLKFLDSLGPGE
jgi:hypothetical protein